MRLTFTLLALLLLAGCRSLPSNPTADAPAQCYVNCTPTLTDTGVRWTADPESPEAWDALGKQDGVIPTLSRLLLQCERARQACAGFLNDLKKKRVLRAKEQP